MKHITSPSPLSSLLVILTGLLLLLFCSPVWGAEKRGFCSEEWQDFLFEKFGSLDLTYCSFQLEVEAFCISESFDKSAKEKSSLLVSCENEAIYLTRDKFILEHSNNETIKSIFNLMKKDTPTKSIIEIEERMQKLESTVDILLGK